VVLGRNALEAMRILKAQSLVVGVDELTTRFPEYWPEFRNHPVTGTWNDPNYEAVAALAPDIFVCFKRFVGDEAEKRLNPLGIRVVRLDFYKPRSMPGELRELAAILGREALAEEFLAWREEKGAAVLGRLARATGTPRVYLESYSPFMAQGPGTGGDEMCALAGGENIGRALSVTTPQITPEWVASEDPEIIVKFFSRGRIPARDIGPAMEAMRREIMARPGWSRVRAVREGRVFVISGETALGPGNVAAQAWLVRWLHPELARDWPPDLEPEALHREYLARFQGVTPPGPSVWPER
jgi:iron complex transport system substrate-binding protein